MLLTFNFSFSDPNLMQSAKVDQFEVTLKSGETATLTAEYIIFKDDCFLWENLKLNNRIVENLSEIIELKIKTVHITSLVLDSVDFPFNCQFSNFTFMAVREERYIDENVTLSNYKIKNLRWGSYQVVLRNKANQIIAIIGQNISDLLMPSQMPIDAKGFYPPVPLSLEDLLTRQGKPVWIKLEDNSHQFSGWAIVFELSSGGVFLQFNAGCEQLPISEYTRTWVAFDHRPDLTVHGATGQGQPFLDKLRSLGQLPDIGPVSVKIPSDYDPNTFLRLTRTDDGDIIFKIVGNGEMRIATSGGMLRGLDLVAVTSAFNRVLDIYKSKDDSSQNL